MALGIIELLRRVGEENVRLQNLVAHTTNARYRKNGFTDITFYTREMSPGDVLNDTGPVGLVLWLPRDLVDAAKRAHAAEQK